MMGDLPSISNAAHSHTSYGLGNLGQAQNTFVGTTSTVPFLMGSGGVSGLSHAAVVRPSPHPTNNQALQLDDSTKPKTEKPMAARRLVQVFIADPDDNIPLKSSLLYSGNQKLTDATDQELFFEIDLKTILEKHNADRVKIVNKKIKERTELLEPARIRDLKMVVVSVATF